MKHVVYDVFVTGCILSGIKKFLPEDGFVSTPHFFELECTSCGEGTAHDLALYPLAPGATPCNTKPNSISSGRSNACYPICDSSGSHVIRRCKACKSLGSLELFSVTDHVPANGRRTCILSLECIGYRPMKYVPGGRWVCYTIGDAKVTLSFRNQDCTEFLICTVGESDAVNGSLKFEFSIYHK